MREMKKTVTEYKNNLRDVKLFFLKLTAPDSPAASCRGVPILLTAADPGTARILPPGIKGLFSDF